MAEKFGLTNLPCDDHIYNICLQGLPVMTCGVYGFEGAIKIRERHTTLEQKWELGSLARQGTYNRSTGLQSGGKPCVLHTIFFVIDGNNLSRVAAVVFLEAEVHRGPAFVIKSFHHSGSRGPFFILVHKRNLKGQALISKKQRNRKFTI